MSLLGVALLSTLVIFSLSVFYYVNRTESAAWQGRQSEAARSAAGNVGGFIQRVKDALFVVAAVETDSLVSDPEELNSLLQQNLAFLEVVRLDSSGHVLASTFRDKSVLANLITIPQSQWFLQARNGQTFIGDVQLSANNAPYLIISVPTGEGGVVAARVQMDVLWEVVRNIHFGRSGQAYVITQNGRVIAHTDPEIVTNNGTLQEQAEFKEMLSAPNNEWFGTYFNITGKRVVGFTRSIPETTWLIVTELPFTEAFSATRNAIYVLGLEVFLLMAIVSWVVARYLRYLVVKPIEQLIYGAERIGLGELNYRIGAGLENEIGQLSVAFDGMASQLQDRDAKILTQTELLRTSEVSLRHLNADLEERVQIRTRDLTAEIAERNRIEQALRDSEARYRAVLQQSLEAIYILDVETGTILEANSAFSDLLGYEANEIPNLTLYDVVEQEKASIDFIYQKILNGEGVELGERQWRKKDGTIVDVEATANKIGQGERAMIFVVARDITKRKEAEMALRDSEERYAIAVRGANDGLWDWNLKTDEIYFSPRWSSMLGFNENEIGNTPEEWFKLVHPQDLPKLRAALDLHLYENSPHFECEYRIRHANKDFLWVLSRGLALRDTEGNVYRMAGSQTDITDRKRAEERLAYDALHDVLTGLPNRVLFMDRLKMRLEHAKRHSDGLFAVLFLDLDRFKVINDSLGHSVGDQFLISIAKHLHSCLRPEDTVSRFGGDEFAILVNGLSDVSDTLRVVERIQRRLMSTTMLSSVHRTTTASIGITLYNDDYAGPEEMLRDADTAMYRAKMLGGGRYQVFDTTMYESALSLLQLEADLKLAVENKEWQVYYQPIVSLESGTVRGVEALVRWIHPERGVVMPLEFIPIAEETGLIYQIGEYVLRTACAQAKAWRDSGQRELWVSVNISGRQFQDKNLIKLVKRTLRETDLPGYALHLEITESVAMKDQAHTVSVLTGLNKLGVKISLDDFGNGYSSLAYLKQFPLNVLKIDRSFIQDNGVDKNGEAITSAIIFMGQTLNLEVIAEGVETPEQLNFLKSQFCNGAQGFLFGKPISAEATTQLFSNKENFLKF